MAPTLGISQGPKVKALCMHIRLCQERSAIKTENLSSLLSFISCCALLPANALSLWR